MSVRNEKMGEELKQYVLNYAEYLAKTKRSVAGLLNGAIYNMPFTHSNRQSLRTLLGCLAQCEELLAKCQSVLGDVR